MTVTQALATVLVGDAVTLTRRDGQTFYAVPVVERRSGGYRLSVRAGFGPQDLFVPFGDVVSIEKI